MKISFGLLTHNEDESLEKLLGSIVGAMINYEYEIVIVDDFSDNPKTKEILKHYAEKHNAKIFQRSLNNDFAAQKNYMTEKCSGDYILNPDADELFPTYILENIVELIKNNDNPEIIWFPRINTVEGLTQEHAQKWNWRVDEDGWINWPDYQGRCYRKDYPRIQWKFPVHERVIGALSILHLPPDKNLANHLAIIHSKTIEKQEKQNEKYDEINKR